MCHERWDCVSRIPDEDAPWLSPSLDHTKTSDPCAPDATRTRNKKTRGCAKIHQLYKTCRSVQFVACQLYALTLAHFVDLDFIIIVEKLHGYCDFQHAC